MIIKYEKKVCKYKDKEFVEYRRIDKKTVKFVSAEEYYLSPQGKAELIKERFEQNIK